MSKVVDSVSLAIRCQGKSKMFQTTICAISQGWWWFIVFLDLPIRRLTLMVDKKSRSLTRSVAFSTYIQPSGASRPPPCPPATHLLSEHQLPRPALARSPSQPSGNDPARPAGCVHTQKNFMRRGYHVARPVLTARGRASRRATPPRQRLSLARPPSTSARPTAGGSRNRLSSSLESRGSAAVIWRRAAAASKLAGSAALWHQVPAAADHLRVPARPLSWHQQTFAGPSDLHSVAGVLPFAAPPSTPRGLHARRCVFTRGQSALGASA